MLDHAGRTNLQPPTCLPVPPPDFSAIRPRWSGTPRCARSGPVKNRHRSAHSTTQPNRTVTVQVVAADHLLLGAAWRNNRARLAAQRGIFAAATQSRPLPHALDPKPPPSSPAVIPFDNRPTGTLCKHSTRLDGRNHARQSRRRLRAALRASRRSSSAWLGIPTAAVPRLEMLFDLHGPKPALDRRS